MLAFHRLGQLNLWTNPMFRAADDYLGNDIATSFGFARRDLMETLRGMGRSRCAMPMHQRLTVLRLLASNTVVEEGTGQGDGEFLAALHRFSGQT